MSEKIDPKKIMAIVDGKTADIEKLDTDIMMETVGVAMALDKLRESLNKVETCMDEGEFEEASHIGYNEVAHNFVYVQRTLAGLQTAAQQKESLISDIAQETRSAYEDVAPYVEEKMQSTGKKQRRDHNGATKKNQVWRAGMNKKFIKSDLKRIDELKNRNIDYSDIPELDESFFSKAYGSMAPC